MPTTGLAPRIASTLRRAAIDAPGPPVDPARPRASRCVKIGGVVADFTRFAAPRPAARTVDSLRLQTRKTVWISTRRPRARCVNPPCAGSTARPARGGRPSGCRRSRPESAAGMACACAVSCPPGRRRRQWRVSHSKRRHTRKELGETTSGRRGAVGRARREHGAHEVGT